MTKKNHTKADFDSLLILFRFCLNEIGVNSISLLGRQLNDADYEGVDSNGDSYFFGFINSLPNNRIDTAVLRQYDGNIQRHIKHIGRKRGGIRLKYFQYFSLLFTEIFLDRYFTDKNGFIKQLNNWLHAKKRESDGLIFFKDYTPGDLSKLAFMCATGSGKTLIMHINILQYLHYFNKAKKANPSLSLNRIILVTPNEGMSQQHLDELSKSEINAEIFSKNGVFSSVCNKNVLIVDINKFADTMGDKTVAVESFESNNLVLVDEAHRGLTSGDAWLRYRKKISENGFTFEYSATFKQSLHANARSSEDKAALEEYGKAIIMDYSYKYFYNDGYGKDYRIFNLDCKYEDDDRNTYLIGCLLAFYQQAKFFEIHKYEIAHYNIAKPLLVFVGNKVTSATSKSELSDIQEIITFIDSFVRNKHQSAQILDDILHGHSGIIDKFGEDIFIQGLRPLVEDIYNFEIPDGYKIFQDILRLIFNSTTTADEPRLHIENIKQVPGEIALRIGDAEDCFGVINVGDTARLIKACDSHNIISHNDEFASTSLFSHINDLESHINILIGSRKFTEGWNSWRVSTMGLINFAKNEGSQAIQLFGRGIRLKGIGVNLKRSSMVEGRHLKNISCIETLWIFGIKAQYMEAFKKMITDEGVPSNEKLLEIKLPVISRFHDFNKHNPRIIRVRPGMNFRKQAGRLILEKPTGDFYNYLLGNQTRIDCMSKAQSILSSDISTINSLVLPELHTIPAKYLPLLDYFRIFHELILYKQAKTYYNINIIYDNLPDILSTEGWYNLVIPEKKLHLNVFSELQTLTDFAILALKSYIDKFYKYHKEKWEAPFLEYTELEADNSNFVDEYTIRYTPLSSTDDNWHSLVDFIDHTSALIAQKGYLEQSEYWVRDRSLCLFDLKSHLYSPLISLTANKYKIHISPVGLNEGEKIFIDRLKEFSGHHPDFLCDKPLFLLRNKSKSGIGFFEASNFYPDFILWIDTPKKQYITFIDPKGLYNVPADSPKILFYSKIKELEKRLQQSVNGKTIILNSFIMSTTSRIQLEKLWNLSQPEWERMNVYTLDSTDCIYAMIRKILAD